MINWLQLHQENILFKTELKSIRNQQPGKKATNLEWQSSEETIKFPHVPDFRGATQGQSQSIPGLVSTG